MAWTCLPFIRCAQHHLARHSERGKNLRQTEKEVGRQHQEMDRPGVHRVPEGSWERRKMEKTGCEDICGAPTTPAVKGKVKVRRVTRATLCLKGIGRHEGEGTGKTH